MKLYFCLAIAYKWDPDRFSTRAPIHSQFAEPSAPRTEADSARGAHCQAWPDFLDSLKYESDRRGLR